MKNVKIVRLILGNEEIMKERLFKIEKLRKES